MQICPHRAQRDIVRSHRHKPHSTVGLGLGRVANDSSSLLELSKDQIAKQKERDKIYS